MAAHSAMIMGASQVYVVDQVPDRLRLAESLGATAIDFSQGDPVEQILDANGGIGVVGVYVPQDPPRRPRQG